MSVVVRRIASRPARTSVDTWEVISKIVCANDNDAIAQFKRVNGVAASIISDEYPLSNPIVVVGAGARLRIYCLYDEDAITGEDVNEDPLGWQITAEHWFVHFPCSSEDFTWVSANLKKLSATFSAYDIKKGLQVESVSKKDDSEDGGLTIDEEAFRKL